MGYFACISINLNEVIFVFYLFNNSYMGGGGKGGGGAYVLLSGDVLRLCECDSILRMYVWLKCYLSGDALHGSGSRINPTKHYRCCVTSYSKMLPPPPPPGSLQLVPVTRIEHWRTNGGLGYGKKIQICLRREKCHQGEGPFY